MKNGAYQYAIRMSAPIGPRYGKLELHLQGGLGNGFLTMFSKRLPIQEVRCCGEELSFSGMMETLLYQLPYTAKGTVSGQAIQMVFDTDKGCFPVEGAVISVDEKEKQEHE